MLENSMSRQLVIAEEIAREAHDGQMRRARALIHGVEIPYIIHVEKVVSLVDSVEEKIVAWLHDVIETDRDAYKMICARGIGKGLVDTVLILSCTASCRYSWYIKQIRIAGDPIAVRVKIADIVAKLTDEPTDKQVRKYYDALKILTLTDERE